MINFGIISLLEWFLITGGYVFVFFTSGRIVVGTSSYIKGNKGEEVNEIHGRAGKIIGKCENFLVLTLVFIGEFTGLTVIFAAEGVLSLEYQDKNYPDYFLSGTMVNFSYSIAISLLIVLAVNFVPTEHIHTLTVMIWVINIILSLIYLRNNDNPLSPFQKILFG